MKTRILALSVTTAILLTSVCSAETTEVKPPVVKATQNSAFSSLRTHRQGKSITATWSMTGLDGVVGFIVQRTDNDPTDEFATWEDLCTMACDASRRFSYNDQEVLPGSVSYRIVAVMDDGTTVLSEISTVRIVSRK